MILTLAFLSVTLLFLIGEVLVRKFVEFEEEHYYRFDAENKLYRRKPNYEGAWHKRNVRGYFTLNNEGWNSTRNYYKERTKDTFRIACIGTSETGSYQVHVKDAWPKILEERLNSAGKKCEVYTFAADRAFGYPHAVHLTRYVVKTFTPDLIIYNSNFPDESIYGTTDKKHYMLLDIDNKGNVREVPPVNDRLPIMGKRLTLKNLLFQSKLIKYLRPKLALGTRFRKLIQLFKGINNNSNKTITEKKADNNQNTNLSFAQKDKIAIDYCLTELKKIQETNSVKLIFGIPVLHGKGFNWNNLTNDQSRINQEKNRAFKISLLQSRNLPFFDISQAFVDDYAKNNKKFDYLLDPHFNQQGNLVLGESISKYLLENGFLDK